MRALCERCAAPQPIDWRAGDLCVACSGPVRREERCFWCHAWSPAGAYCRACGAEHVAAESYGAARMLLRTGADMFSIPKLVREMDPGRLAVFASQYAQQRAHVARHVEDLRFVERFLVQRDFSGALEERLLAELPWAPAQLAPMAAVTSVAQDGLPRLRELEERSPFAETRELAAIARLWARDWSAHRQVARMAGAGLEGRGVPAEAALAATWWRAMTALSLSRAQVPWDSLAQLPFPAQVAVRLGALGRPADARALADAKVSGNPELAFAAALATRDAAALEAALGADEEMQRAAARTLAAMGRREPLVNWFASASPAAQADVIAALQQSKEGAGPLTEAILRVMESEENTPRDSLRTSCGVVLARGAPLEVALRVAELSRGAMYVVQALVAETSGLAPHETAQVLAVLAERGWLRASSYGVEAASKRGAIPDSFVPAVFARANAETRHELCRIAEQQLEARRDPALHAFLLQTVFGPFNGKLRAAAWWSLSRGYARQRYGWFGPLSLEPAVIATFFPSVPAFLDGFTAVLGDFATLKEVGLFDFLHRLTHDLDAAKVQALLAYDCHAFVEAMRAASQLEVWSPLRDSLRKAVALFDAQPERARRTEV